MAKKAYVLGVSAAALLASAVTASAGGFMLREQSAYGQGASFAGAAAPGEGISGMYWNPAAVTNHDGWIYTESHHSFIFPESELNVDPSRTTLAGAGLGNGGNVGRDAWVPSGYFSYNVNDQIYLGLSVNGAYGLATTSELPWVGQLDHYKAKVFSTNVSPTIGYKVNDQLSVAVGAQIQYFKVDVQTALAASGDPPTQDLEGDDIGFGFTAGLTYEPVDGTTIGLGYRSRIKHNLEGTQTLGAAVGPFPAGIYNISADATLPDLVTLGVRQRITDSFTMLAGVEWANWSVLGTVPIQGGLGSLEFEYEDGWYFALGGEYAYNDALTLRAGVGYELSPVQDAYRSMRLPDQDRFWASVGASYDFNEKLSLDAAYTHIFVKDAPIDHTTQTAGGPVRYAGTAEGNVDIFSFSLRYKM